MGGSLTSVTVLSMSPGLQGSMRYMCRVLPRSPAWLLESALSTPVTTQMQGSNAATTVRKHLHCSCLKVKYRLNQKKDEDKDLSTYILNRSFLSIGVKSCYFTFHWRMWAEWKLEVFVHVENKTAMGWQLSKTLLVQPGLCLSEKAEKADLTSN